MKCPACGAAVSGSSRYCPACGEPVPTESMVTRDRDALGPPPPPLYQFSPGDLLGTRFMVVEEIGVGGMGAVYKARDQALGRYVAVKLLRPEVARRALSVERFKRELSMARQVSHANVCRVHDMVEIDGLYYISMEYVDGQSLQDLMQSVGTLSPRQTVSLARQICSGLRAIHENSIVHRDLKPANIMLDRSGRAVIMDFGLAHHAGAASITGEGEVLGTLAYLSPEQADGRPFDERTDIYALGLVLFEMLTGRRAPGDGGRAPLAMRSGETCPPPSRFTPEVPPSLDAIVLRCLERNPDRRCPSAAEIDDSLAALEDLGSEASAIAPKRPFAHPSLAIALAAAVAVLIALFFVTTWSPAPPGEPPEVALLPLAYEGRAESAYLRNLLPLIVGDELRGSTEIFVAPFSASRRFSPQEDVRAVAEQLGVTHVVRGEIRVDGSGFRATLDLHGAEGSFSWSKVLEGGLQDMIDSMNLVAEDVADSLGVRLSPIVGLMRERAPAALEAYVEGQTYLEGWDVERSYLRAEDAFRRAVAGDADFTEAHAALARALWIRYRETRETELVSEALRSAEKAVSQDPTLPEAHLAVGMVQLGRGRTAEASASLRRAQELAPEDDHICQWIARAFASFGRHPDAEAMFQRAIDLRPAFWGNYNAKGIYLMNRGELDEAKKLFRQIIELRPESDAGYSNLASAHLMAGELGEAEPLLLAALRINRDAPAHNNLGFIYYSTDRFDRAAGQFESAVELGPEDALSWGNLGDALRQLGRTHEAHEAYTRAVELTERQLEVNPMHAEARLGLAMLLAGLGRCNEVEREVSSGLGADTPGPYLHYYAALAFATCDRRARAIEHTKKAIEGGVVADVRTNPDLRPLIDEPSIRKLLP